ncbi:mitochondrial large ribosomal subunit protein [Rutstroemia sp. NJR-2017a WRK4]|nr:mitochondrial large ribosomal subunit protein [Rutstroemia sp. NJR-2017a WRK4]
MATTMPLQFLRPMGLPRVTTLRRFLGVAKLSTDAPKATASMSPPVSTPTKPATAPNQPYRVSRTPSNNFPIYLLSKAGGNLKQTKVRKIEGDIQVLRTQLQKALGLKEREVTINQLTQQIIIKGHRKPEVEKFLEERHF